MDNLKGFLIFCVVLGHICEEFSLGHPNLKYLLFFIYLFHMPCFIYISGYFSKNYSFKKNANLIYIFIIFGIFYTIIINLLPDKQYTFSFAHPPWAFWYLISLFLWRTLTVFIKDKNPFIILLISFVLSLSVGCFENIGYYFSLGRTISFLPFFLLGYYSNQSIIATIKNIPKLLSCTLIIFAIIITIIFVKLNILPLEFQWGAVPYLYMKISNLKGIILKIILFIIELFTSFAIFNLMTTNETFLTKIGNNSLAVFILHPIIILVICNFIKDTYWIKGLIYIIVFILSILLTLLLSSNTIQRFFNFLMKPYKKIVEN